MRFASRCVFAIDACRKIIAELQLAKLFADPIATAARDNAKRKLTSERADHGASTGQKQRSLLAIGAPPKTVRALPGSARNLRRAVDLIPVGTVDALEIGDVPINFESAKHCEVCANIRRVGVEQGAVPIEQDDSSTKDFARHGREY